MVQRDERAGNTEKENEESITHPIFVAGKWRGAVPGNKWQQSSHKQQ